MKTVMIGALFALMGSADQNVSALKQFDGVVQDAGRQTSKMLDSVDDATDATMEGIGDGTTRMIDAVNDAVKGPVDTLQKRAESVWE